jgi:hypothetical protein
MPEFNARGLALSQEIDRVHVNERLIIEVKRDCWSGVFKSATSVLQDAQSTFGQ